MSSDIPGRSDNPFRVIWGYPPLQGSREAVCPDIVEGRPEGSCRGFPGA